MNHYVGIKITFRVLCPHCNTYNQVAGLKGKIHCYKCMRNIHIEQMMADARTGGIKYHFGAYYDIIREAIAVLEEGAQGHDRSDQCVKLQFDYWKKKPSCIYCKANIPFENIAEADRDHINCPECSKPIPLRKADKTLKHWDKRISFILNDTGEDTPGTAKFSDNESDGVVVRCESCGRGLEIGEERIVTCPACDSVNIIPDAAWLRLAPATKKIPFFLIAEYTDEDLLDAWLYFLNSDNYGLSRKQEFRNNLLEKIQGYLKNLDPDSLSSLLAGKGRGPLRKIVANMKNSPMEALETLIEKGKAETVKMILEKENLPKRILEKLAKDPRIEIRFLLLDKNDLPADILETLAYDGEFRIRQAVARHPGASKELLKMLKKDYEPLVRKAVKENPNYRDHFFW